MMKPTKMIGIGLIAVGGIDLLFGNTNQPVLPAFIANNLTQQTDAILIGAGIVLIFFL